MNLSLQFVFHVLSLVRFEPFARRINLRVHRPLRSYPPSTVILVPLLLKHELALCVHDLLVGEDGLRFLRKGGFHLVCQVVCHRIQKFKLFLYFLLAQGAHGHELFEEPLVALTKLSQLDALVLLVDDAKEHLSETLVQLNSVRLREARSLDNVFLSVIHAKVSHFLSIYEEGFDPCSQLDVHLVVSERRIINHLLHRGELRLGHDVLLVKFVREKLVLCIVDLLCQ